MKRRGRPRLDWLALVERVVEVLCEEPDLSASEVQRRVRGRRNDVLRLVRILRAAETPQRGVGEHTHRYPNRESGKNGATSDGDSRSSVVELEVAGALELQHRLEDAVVEAHGAPDDVALAGCERDRVAALDVRVRQGDRAE